MLRLAQDPDGALSFPIRLVDGVESVLAALYNVFSTQTQDELQATSDGVVEVIAGEWPFNKSHGMRWRGVVLRKYFSAEDTKALVADTANQIPEIQSVTTSQVTLTFDNEQRRVNILLSNVRLTSGDTIDQVSLDIAV